MMDSLLAEQEEPLLARAELAKTRKHLNYALTVVCLLVGLLVFGYTVSRPHNHSQLMRTDMKTNLESPRMQLKSSRMCDTCEVIPELTDYSICRTCRFHINEDKELKCPVGQGDVRIYDVEVGTKHDAKAIVLVYNHCKETSNGKMDKGFYECTVNLMDLMKADKETGSQEFEDQVNIEDFFNPDAVSHAGDYMPINPPHNPNMAMHGQIPPQSIGDPYGPDLRQMNPYQGIGLGPGHRLPQANRPIPGMGMNDLSMMTRILYVCNTLPAEENHEKAESVEEKNRR